MHQLLDGKTWHASHFSPAHAPMEDAIKSELMSLPLQSVPSSTLLPIHELVNLPSQTASPSVPERSSSLVKCPLCWSLTKVIDYFVLNKKFFPRGGGLSDLVIYH